MSSSKKSLPALLLFLCSVIILLLGFYRNQWNVVREKKFKDFQMDSESLVMARMVESRQNGIAAENGLLGWGDVHLPDLNEADYLHQFDVYLSGGEFQTYSLYKSLSGFQAMVFSLFDGFSPFSPEINLRNFRALVSLLLAMTLSAFILWALQEFGWLTALLVLATTLVSQWMTLFGRNLFYVIWASFLPLALMLWFFVWEERSAKSSDSRLAWLGFGSILFKCMMNGYDFIVPTLAMTTVPLVYYGLRNRWERPRFFKRFGILSLAMLAAVFVSILILAAQLSASEGGFFGGIASILSTFSRRTYGDPDLYPLYAESLKANPLSVLWIYLVKDTAINLAGLRFIDLIIIFAAFSALYLIVDRLKKGSLPDRGKSYSLLGATWFSILSPITWFLVFKGQAYVHTHTNYLAWHMPFTLFGFTLCGMVLRSLAALFAARPR